MPFHIPSMQISLTRLVTYGWVQAAGGRPFVPLDMFFNWRIPLTDEEIKATNFQRHLVSLPKITETHSHVFSTFLKQRSCYFPGTLLLVWQFLTVLAARLWKPVKCNENYFMLQLDMLNFDPGLNGYRTNFDMLSSSFPLLSMSIPSYLTCPVTPGLILEWWKMLLMQNLCHCAGNHRKFRGVIIKKKKNYFLAFTVKISSWKAKVLYSWTYSKWCSIHINKQKLNKIHELDLGGMIRTQDSL